MTHPPFAPRPPADFDWRVVTHAYLARLIRLAWQRAGHAVDVTVEGGEIRSATRNGWPV